MAHRMLQAQQHVFHYQSFHINKSQSLGHGSYGAVYKAKCDQLLCAAKVLHPTILDPRDPGSAKIMDRFQQECAFLESIRHPNIVQYLGMTRDPESRLPVLLMELLDGSLTKMLERSQQLLAYYVQVDICHDIALAVTYLHSNDIIHRDLSSNNVLMIAGRRAKVTDFGMSKLAGAAPSMTPLTMCPGTLAYMPPEALREPPRYTKKLDCFSEGVIMIQVCTRLWPEPGPRTQIIQDSRYPMGVVEVPVSEIERRKNHIELIDPNHALLRIAKNCIHFQEKDRPSSEELCQSLAGLKQSRKYRESVQNHQDEILAKENQITVLTQQLQHRADEIISKNQQLQENDRLLQQRVTEITSLSEQLQVKEGTISAKDNQLQEQSRQHREERASKERQFRQLNQQLEEQEQVTAEIQQTNHSLQRQVEQLQQQLSQQSLNHKPHPHRERKSWRGGGKAPIKMCRGATVVDGDVAYFMSLSGEVSSYKLTSKMWSNLPGCPYYHSGLAVINGRLIAISGCTYVYNKDTYTNKLLSLPGYKEIFPPMPTKRWGTTAVTSKEHLIVAGGATGPHDSDIITTVEVMDTKTLAWSEVASLPHPYRRASMTICGNQLYMLGGENDKGKSKSVLTCSLTELLQSSSPSSSSWHRLLRSSSSSIWHRVADAPAYLSTCATVNGELLAIGGLDVGHERTSAIHKYNPTTNSWDLISNMPTARSDCLIAVFPTNEMMVVGGKLLGRAIDIIEIASFSTGIWFS